MAAEQYRTGLVTVANASPTVIGTASCDWLNQLAAGHVFKLDQDGEVTYTIATILTATRLVLSANYADTGGSGLNYIACRSFSVNRGFWRPLQGDHDWAEIMSQETIDKIDTDVQNLITSDVNLNASIDSLQASMDLAAPKASPIFTGVVTAPTIDLTGGQIAFPADAVPSADPNTLDDYEEGVFEVVIACSTSGGYTMATSKNLAYTKTGRDVFVNSRLIITSEDSPNGELKVSIPFAVIDLIETSERGTGSAMLYNHGGDIPNGIYASYAGNNAFFTLVTVADNGTPSSISNGDVDTAFDLWFSFTYMAN